MIIGTVALTGCTSEKKADTGTIAGADGGSTDKETTAEAAEGMTDRETTAKTEDGATDVKSTESASSGKSAANGLFGTFNTITHYGSEVTQDIFTEADLTMVNIWGTFCSPCIREMPDLGELADEYADKGVQIVGIVSDVTAAWNTDVELIIQETGADYTHLMVSQSLWNSYLSNVQVVPTTVFVDSEGKQVGEVYTGSRDKEAWAAIIEEMLGLLEE